MPDVQNGGLFGAVPGPKGRADPASVPGQEHPAAPVQGPSIEDQAREACNRHYAGGERDGWRGAPRWETVGPTHQEWWRRVVRGEIDGPR